MLITHLNILNYEFVSDGDGDDDQYHGVTIVGYGCEGNDRYISVKTLMTSIGGTEVTSRF